MTDDLKERVINSHAVKCGGATDGVKGTYVLLRVYSSGDVEVNCRYLEREREYCSDRVLSKKCIYVHSKPPRERIDLIKLGRISITFNK